MDTAYTAFRFALDPTPGQRIKLERFAQGRRYVYNWALDRWRAHFREHGSSPTVAFLCSELASLKRQPGREWLKAADAQALQQAIWDLRRAFDNFFGGRSRYPRFKSAKTDPLRFRIPQRVALRGNRLYVPKVGLIKVRLSRPVGVATRAATFKQDPTGRWFVTLVARVELPDGGGRRPAADHVVGIDLGIKTFAVLSDGRKIEQAPVPPSVERRLRRAHRSVSRKRPGSHNRDRARQRLAREYLRATDCRRDFLHKLTTALVQEFDLLSIEDLGVRGMARTKLARHFQHTAFREFRRQLTYKAAWRGKKVVVIDRFFPSSKRCPDCGVVRKQLSLSQREWACGGCGKHHDRDHAAARNILEQGLIVAAGRADTETPAESASDFRWKLPAENQEFGLMPKRQHGGALLANIPPLVDPQSGEGDGPGF